MARNNINKLVNMDYETLIKLQKSENRDYFESIIRSMTRSANRRIKELKSELVGQYSPALMHLKETTGKDRFTTRGLKTAKHNQLLKQYSQLKDFLRAKSSTLKGWTKIRKDIVERTGAKKLFGSKYKSQRSATLWHNREKRFWELYNKLKDNYGGRLTELDSNRIQELLIKVQTMRNMAKSNDDISMAMAVYVDKLYSSKSEIKTADDRNAFDLAFLDTLKTDEGMEEIRITYEELDL